MTAADTVIINATNGNDVIFVSSNNGVVTVTGLAETVTISNFDANDRIVINGLGGDDVIEATGLAAGILLTADGGEGDDVLIGGHGRRHPARRCGRRHPDRRLRAERARRRTRQQRRDPRRRGCTCHHA